jgi:hypothetical protein
MRCPGAHTCSHAVYMAVSCIPYLFKATHCEANKLFAAGQQPNWLAGPVHLAGEWLLPALTCPTTLCLPVY